jgi:hypothetical protein
MPKEHRVNKAITITESLWERLGELGEELEYKDRSHSQLISEMVSSTITKWRESPYVCQRARHFVLVTGGGHVFYQLTQDLKLNSDRQKLPCIMEMKPEKRQDFLDSKPCNMDESEWFRSRWILNHFAVWHSEESSELQEASIPLSAWTLLDSRVDRLGTDYKMADLIVQQEAGRSLTREIIVGIQDYVQWRGEDRGYDRIDIPIDIPTRNLEVIVMVDVELYRKTSRGGMREIQNLGIEFRNREGARFGTKEIYDPENIIEPYAGRHLAEKPSIKAQKVLSRLSDLEGRIRLLARSEVKDGPVVSEEGLKKIDVTFNRPKQFLFFKLDWASPSLGLEVCVHWQKAVRVD